MRAVTQLGHHLAHDWVAIVDEHGANPKADRTQRRAWVDECFERVLVSDLVWWLSPAIGSTGAGAELGFAYRAGIPLIASGPCTSHTIMTSVARAFPTDRAALEWIASKAPWRGTPADRSAPRRIRPTNPAGRCSG